MSIVDSVGAVLLDELVRPQREIEDYNTRYSGITEEMLANVTTTLEQVRERVCKIISAETIVVGHSLENDFKALKITHHKVIDTSVLYPHAQGHPYKNSLKYLANK